MIARHRVASLCLIFSVLRVSRGGLSSEFSVKRSNNANESEKSEFDYRIVPRGDLQGAAATHFARYYDGPSAESYREPTPRSDPFASGSYGLAFVAPSTFGYGSQGAYDNAREVAQYAGPSRVGLSIAGLGPGRYAFPIFDYGQGLGGFGGLGYLGQSLGFAYPGFGFGNKLFSDGVLMRHF